MSGAEVSMNKPYFSIVLFIFGMTTSAMIQAGAYGLDLYRDVQAMMLHEENICYRKSTLS